MTSPNPQSNPGKKVRVGLDETVRPELLSAFPPEAEIVRIPLRPVEIYDVDLWILPFHRRDAEEVFRHLRGVQVVQSMMAGVDWIVPWLPRDVILCDGRGIHDISASEWVLAAILASLKRLPTFRDSQLRGEWRTRSCTGDPLLDDPGPDAGQYRLLGDDLAGKTVLIVGFGSIGAAIEQRLLPFGVDILRLARTPKTEPLVHETARLHDLIPQADIVVLILPMTAETRGLISHAELALMRPGALLVNAARGPVVDTGALVEALAAGRIRAALDVTDPEPLPPEHPLWRAPNCLITPHTGGSTPLFIERAFRFGAAQVRRFVNGEALQNIVTEHGY